MDETPGRAVQEDAANHTRTCAGCGRQLRVPARYADLAVKCPNCGVAVEPVADGGEPSECPPRDHSLASLLGWGVSLLLHVLLLTGLAGYSLFAPSREGGTELPVGVVVDTPKPEVSTAVPEPPSAQVTLPSLQAPELQAVGEMEALPDVAAGPGSASSVEEIGLVDISLGGGSQAMAKDGWSSFAGAGGNAGGGGKASFFGLEAQGKNFVYVVDYSGSMVGDKELRAKQELVRSISALERTMSFMVIFYDDKFVRMPSKELVRATDANKRKYFAWINSVHGGGGTEPAAPMIAALGFKPDAVWLLSDGLFDASAADEIKAANPDASVQIHTVAFFENTGEEILQRIAEENRGRYRFVSPSSMGMSPRRTRHGRSTR